MAANQAPIFPLTPKLNIASLVSPTPVTSRAVISGNTGLTLLCPTSTEGTRIDKIFIKGQESTVSSIVMIWLFDGSNSYLMREIQILPVTASDTVASDYEYIDFVSLVIPPTYSLYISTTVSQNITVFCSSGQY